MNRYFLPLCAIAIIQIGCAHTLPEPTLRSYGRLAPLSQRQLAHSPVVVRAANAVATAPSNEARFASAMLTVRVAGRRRCIVRVDSEPIGYTPLEASVPMGNHRVAVKCGKRTFFAARVDFASGGHRRLMLEKKRRKLKRTSRRRNRG